MSIGPTVSVITPSFARESFLQRLEHVVALQSHADLEWLIYDDSTEPSPYFSDPAVAHPRPTRYVHSPNRLRIGEKRNRLCELASGELIVHFDDDDYYAPNYVATMVERLAHADLAKLSAWFLYSGVYRSLGYWDTTVTTGLHHVWSHRDADLCYLAPANNAGLRSTYLGFGFSYAYRKSAWEKAPFPDVDWNEDAPFAQRVEATMRFCHFADTRGLCLHVLHQNNTSKCFPQYVLPSFLLERIFGDDVHDTVRLAGASVP